MGSIGASKHGARLIVMYMLRERIRDLTYQELANVFEMRHRSSALRDMRTLTEVDELLPYYSTRLVNALSSRKPHGRRGSKDLR